MQILDIAKHVNCVYSELSQCYLILRSPLYAKVGPTERARACYFRPGIEIEPGRPVGLGSARAGMPCLVTGTLRTGCVVSHLISVRLLQAKFNDGGVQARRHTFHDPYDVRVGVLLDSAVDRCVDQFWSSFIISAMFFLSTLIL
jgi:hypothetical protein